MNCLICKKEGPIQLFQKEDLSLVKCVSCGLVWVDNWDKKFDIKHYDYYKNRINLTQEQLYNSITTKRYVNLLTRLEHYRKNNAILDIGCGEGHFLSVAQKMHWQAEGIEIAPHAAEICRKFNINVKNLNLLELNLEDNHYDIITMFEVLEHLTLPREYLMKINSILRKGGIFIMTTPNFNCLTRRIMHKKWNSIHKEHLFYYNSDSIQRLIRSANFKIIEFRTKSINLPELHAFLTMKDSNKIHIDNQALRKTAEEARTLAYLKKLTNFFLNVTQLGETIECICQKI